MLSDHRVVRSIAFRRKSLAPAAAALALAVVVAACLLSASNAGDAHARLARASVLLGAQGVDPFIQQGAKLVGSGGSTGPMQGSSVALSKDGATALIGAPEDNGAQGAAWVFTRSGSTWTQQGPKLVGTGATGAAAQGDSVALSADGNTALIGGDEDNGEVGAAWVFTRSGSTWTQQGPKLVGTGAIGTAGQGTGVALSGDGNTALIGGPYDNKFAGATWVFTRSGSTWVQQGPKLVGSGGSIQPTQGWSVALSGDGNAALIGAPGDDGFQGAAWAFTRSGSAWAQQGPKLIGTGATGSPEQGNSVALSGDGTTALVGGPDDGIGPGAAWVFTRAGSAWAQQGPKLVGTGATGVAERGYSVALSGDGNTALLGALWDDAGAGAAWAFTRSGSAWAQQGPKLVGTGASGSEPAFQGSSVALSGDGDTALIGGPDDANSTGAAWAFTSSSGGISNRVTRPNNHFNTSHIIAHRDGTVTVTVTVPGPGAVEVLETARAYKLVRGTVRPRPAARAFVFARARRVTRRAATLHLRVNPNARGRQLVHDHAFGVTLSGSVSYTPKGGRRRTIRFHGVRVPT